MSIEALKLARNFIKFNTGSSHYVIEQLDQAIAEAEKHEVSQEPVAVKHMMEWVAFLKARSDNGQHKQIPSNLSAGACWDLAVELEQFIHTRPQPKREPLTDEQILSFVNAAPALDTAEAEWLHVARAIEAAVWENMK